MNESTTPEGLRERNRRTAKLLIAWIVGLAIASIIVGVLR